MARTLDLTVAAFGVIVVIIYSYILYKKEKDPDWDDTFCFALILLCAIAQDIVILVRVFGTPFLT